MGRFYFLRKLRSFGVCSRRLGIFYQSVVASALFYAAGCWGSIIVAGNTNKLNKPIRKTSSVIGCKMDTMVERRMLNQLLSILDNPDQPLRPLLDRQKLLFKQTDSATLLQGQIQEILVILISITLFKLVQHFSTSSD